MGVNVAVIIPAAGSSRRFAEADAESGGIDLGPRSKLDEDLGGRPVLQRTVELFTKHPDVTLVIVAGPADEKAMAAFKDRHADKLAMLGAHLCAGGPAHRYQTVRNALSLVPADGSITHVAVHDAARPCTSAALIDRVFQAAGDGGHAAVIPAIDVPDTLKRVTATTVAASKPDPLAAILGAGGGAARATARLVEETIDRARLVAVQTPQVFALALLRRAYAQADLTSTDDAQLVERLGEPVVVVPGEPTNIKITRPADVPLARAILGVKPPAQRDVHKRF